MKRLLSFAIVPLFMLFLGLALATPQHAFAQDHVVSPSDLQKDVAAASASREQNRQQLQNLISSPEAQRALRSAHIDSQQVKSAVSQLSDSDLARLSVRSEKAQKDFAAGTLSDRDLIIIIVAIAVLILIIVAVR
jgi:hypothetical protein